MVNEEEDKLDEFAKRFFVGAATCLILALLFIVLEIIYQIWEKVGSELFTIIGIVIGTIIGVCLLGHIVIEMKERYEEWEGEEKRYNQW